MMFIRVLLGASIVAASGFSSGEAHAQAAAEEAVVLSGTSAGTGSASSELGNAVSGSISGATRQIRTVPRGTQGRPAPRRRGTVRSADALPADSDPLENTDAPAYELSNGATLRVSGGMRNSAAARCTENCTGSRRANVITVGQEPQPEPEPAPEPDAHATEEPATQPEATEPD